jgi:hypothetical protein
MTDTELAILMDAGLSTDARIVALAILQRGDGWHEVSRDDACDLLSNEASPDRARRAIHQLERRGTLERRAGGRGHADSFKIKSMENPHPKIKGTDSAHPKTVKGTDSAHPKATVVEDDDEVRPPIVPLAELEPRTEAVVDLLNGCRGAIRDYLLAHVPSPDRRYSYAQTVRSWMDGADPSVWRLPDGGSLPKPERAAALAAALNEMAAGEERKMKRPVGDPANLKTKLNINLKQRQAHERPTAAPHGGRPAAASRATAGGPGHNPERRLGWGDLDVA